MSSIRSKYYIFGTEACQVIAIDGVDELIQEIIDGQIADVEYSLFKWDKESTPDELLEEAIGWLEYREISPSDYDKIMNYRDEIR